MKLDKILKYQAVDQELMNIENAISKSDEFQRFGMYKIKVAQAQDAIAKLQKEAMEVMRSYGAIKDKLDELKSQLDDFDGIIEGVQDLTEADHYLKIVMGLDDKIAALEKEAIADASRLEQIVENYKKTWEQGVHINEQYKKAKVALDAQLKSHQPEVEKLKAEMESLKKDIPEKVMNAYMSLRSAKKTPPLVAFDANSNRCGRCFMEVPNDTKAKLRNPGDVAECPNCRRILYIPEE